MNAAHSLVWTISQLCQSCIIRLRRGITRTGWTPSQRRLRSSAQASARGSSMRMSWLARAVSRCTSFWHSGRVSSSRKSYAQARPVRAPAEHCLSTFWHSSSCCTSWLRTMQQPLVPWFLRGAAATALPCAFACEAVVIEHLLLHESFRSELALSQVHSRRRVATGGKRPDLQELPSARNVCTVCREAGMQSGMSPVKSHVTALRAGKDRPGGK